MPVEVKKHIFGVYLSAMGYNSQATLTYMESKGITQVFVKETLDL